MVREALTSPFHALLAIYVCRHVLSPVVDLTVCSEVVWVILVVHMMSSFQRYIVGKFVFGPDERISSDVMLLVGVARDFTRK